MYTKTPGCQIPNLIDIYMKQFGFITDGFFVEVGAFNGYNWSNTYCLAEVGWGGLAIEPHPIYSIQLWERFKDNPRIITENVCAGRSNGKARLYLGGSNSTVKQEMIETYNNIEWAKFSGLREDNHFDCKQMTLNLLLVKHNVPIGFEVLVIDVEGAEIDVLRGFCLDYWQPQLAIVETHKHNEDERLARKSIWIDLHFAKFGYQEIYSDHINSVYSKEK